MGGGVKETKEDPKGAGTQGPSPGGNEGPEGQGKGAPTASTFRAIGQMQPSVAPQMHRSNNQPANDFSMPQKLEEGMGLKDLTNNL